MGALSRPDRLALPTGRRAGEQGKLFAAYRYHACFTDSPMTLVKAEAQHRGHAIIEQVIEA